MNTNSHEFFSGIRVESSSHWVSVCMAVLAALFVPLSAFADGVTPLADAIESQQAEVAAALLADSATQLDAAQPDGMTALHWSAFHDDIELSEKLIAAGAKCDRPNRYGVAPLSIACTNGNASVVKLLLDAGADPNRKLPGGETPLMTAARTGVLPVVQTLIEAGAKVNARESKKQTAIMWAAAEGHARVVEALIDADAEYAEPLSSGFSPIFFAVREGHWPVVKTLLDAGVDVNVAMKHKKRKGRGSMPGTSLLTLAIENGHFEMAIKLLEAGADPNDDRSGSAPLHRMTWVRKPDRGDGLQGAPPPIGSGNVDSSGIVKALIEHGADVNFRINTRPWQSGPMNKKGATPLLMAARTADVPFMKVLLTHGADWKIGNDDETTPLMAAAGVGCHSPVEEAGTEEEALEAVKLLLDIGADINAVNELGDSVIHGAAYKSFPRVVKLLDERGADIEIWNRPNKKKWTPLHIARGYRPGNFKPSPATVEMIESIMVEVGLDLAKHPKPPGARKGY